jgi:hypothetical protein
VVAADPPFRVLAQNDLNEEIYASFAVSNGTFVIRTENNLYCVEKEGKKRPIALHAYKPTPENRRLRRNRKVD